ncbi:hypothetical protein TNIN_180791, partial [Trichonephila inaurata madagascariensis]
PQERRLQTTLRPHTSHPPGGKLVRAGLSSLIEGPQSLRRTKGFFRSNLSPLVWKVRRGAKKAVRRAGHTTIYLHPRNGFRLRGVQQLSIRMVASRHRWHHRAQYQMSEPTVPLVLGKFYRSNDQSSS